MAIYLSIFLSCSLVLTCFYFFVCLSFNLFIEYSAKVPLSWNHLFHLASLLGFVYSLKNNSKIYLLFWLAVNTYLLLSFSVYANTYSWFLRMKLKRFLAWNCLWLRQPFCCNLSLLWQAFFHMKGLASQIQLSLEGDR